MFNFFKKKSIKPVDRLRTDVHSHLLPNLDDGVESYEEAIKIVKGFYDLGYQKLITTPHIMRDFYNNSEDDIRLKIIELNSLINQKGLNIEVLPGAEYYLDESLLESIKDSNKEFLTFGDNYLLFETSFMNEPFYLKEFIFEAKSRGINPIMAHPERYAYIHGDFEIAKDLIDRGVLFQVNINSFVGYYSKEVKKTAEKLVDAELVHLLGSDCHNLKHFDVLQKSRTEKYYYKALQLPLINYTL